MAALFLTSLLLLDHTLLSLAQGGSEPLQVTASSHLYGPDGPWQAVSVQLGNPPQTLDLYPGGVFQSSVFTNQLCQDVTANPCGSGGLYDPDLSSTIDNTSISYVGVATSPSGSWTDGAMLLSYSDEATIREQLQIADQTVANFSVTTYANVSMVYPDGNYPLQVGALSLGPNVNQSFSETVGPALNSSLIPGSLAAKNTIPSSSFGLHVGIGVKALKLELSLWLGGYDASRIVGPVSSQSIQNDAGSEFVIDLLDIGIGVDNGGSPFPFSSQQGLLSAGNSSISAPGVPVFMNPSVPYMNLPGSTCAAIAKVLPVTYNAGKALYFWDVSDPQYAKIVTSPTYLSFVFGATDGNLTIHVPFSLLNLTLQEPLVSTPTPYFPCQPPQAPDNIPTYYSLGRAFLQAAFIGVTWTSQGVGQWYLAQAPGPVTDTYPQGKPLINGSPPVGLSTDWSGTWRGIWTALPLPPSATTSTIQTPAEQSGTPSPLSKHSLSDGAIAGIVIGAVVAVLVPVALGIWLFRRRRGGSPETVQKEGGEPVGNNISQELTSELPANRHSGVQSGVELKSL